MQDNTPSESDAAPAPPATLLGGGGSGAPSFTPSYDGALNADGTFTEGWHARALGPDYNGPLAQAKSVGDVDKMLRDSMAAARQRTDGMVRVPGEKSTPEEVAAFRKSLGVPDKADDYGQVKPDSLPAELWSSETDKALKEVAHKHHLTTGAVKDIMQLYAANYDASVKQEVAHMERSMAAGEAKLREVWGPKFDSNLGQAARFAATLGFDLTDPRCNDAVFIQAMAQGASMIGEEKLVNGETIGFAKTPHEQAVDIMTNKNNPHYAAYQSGDAAAQNLVNNLLSQKKR